MLKITSKEAKALQRAANLKADDKKLIAIILAAASDAITKAATEGYSNTEFHFNPEDDPQDVVRSTVINRLHEAGFIVYQQAAPTKLMIVW